MSPAYLVAAAIVVCSAIARATPPNVLFILVDDFGWNDVGYHGSTFYETPHLDALAEEWTRFDHCYTPSPMCSPTRTSILTGKNPARHGVTQWLSGTDRAFVREGERPRVYCPPSQSSGITAEEITLGEAFQQAGYDTAFHGKWHMGKLDATGGPARHGYATQQAIIEENRCSMFYPFKDESYFPEARPGDNFTDLLTDASIEFVTAKRESPFYLHLAYFAMHAPIESKPEYREHFAAKAANLPPLPEDRVMDPYAHRPQKLRQDDVEYAGELANLDANIGRLVSALKTAGLYENTLIILTGDNGGRSSYLAAHPTSSHPLRTGKTFLFEGGIRTPLLVHWPKHSHPGRHSNVPVVSMDFYPTLLEMAGLPLRPEQHVDGISLAPLISGQATELPRDAFYWHFPHFQGEGAYPASAIRVGDFKLIHHYHQQDTLLFNLREDPFETTNLAASLPDQTRQLYDRLMAYLTQVEAYIPRPVKDS